MIEAGLPGSLAIVELSPAGGGDQEHGLAPGLVANLAGDLVAVDLGQANIQQDGVGAEVGGGLERRSVRRVRYGSGTPWSRGPRAGCSRRRRYHRR